MTPKNKAGRTLGDLYPALGLVDEPGALRSVEIQRLADVSACGPGDLVFLAESLYLAKAEEAAPAAFVVSEALLPALAEKRLRAPVLVSRDAKLAFARVSGSFQTEVGLAPGRHPTAIVHPSALVADTARLGPYVTIEEGAVVEAGVQLHARVAIGPRSRIGRDTVLFPGVVVYQDVTVGARVRVHANSVLGADGFGYVQERGATGLKHVKIHHLGGLQVGDDVEIGASTTVDRGTLGDTVLGAGTILDNNVQIGHNAVTEEGVVMCGCSALAGSAYVEKFAFLAGYVAVTNKIRVGAGAMIAAYTLVSSRVPAGATWGGLPGMSRKDYLRAWAYIGRLPELFAERKKKNGTT